MSIALNLTAPSSRLFIRSTLSLLFYCVALMALAALLPATAHAQFSDPDLPQSYVNTVYPTNTGTTRNVDQAPYNGNLQTAIDMANPGDTIILTPGATYSGNFILRNKNTSSNLWIIIRSASTAFDSTGSIPPETRVNGKNSAHTSQMPMLRAAIATPVFLVEPRAHHYRLVGLDVGAPTSITNLTAMIEPDGNSYDNAANDRSDMTTNIVIDRCYVHGNDTGNYRRGVALNGNHWAVIDSYISNFHDASNSDSQAVISWGADGPLKIVNNYLEAASENIMLGGSTPAIQGLVTADVEIRHNYVSKPTSWKGQWNVKNLLESKNSRRVLVTGNIFENNWSGSTGFGGSQDGFAIVLKSTGDSTGSETICTWCVTEHYTFTNNIIRHTGGVLNAGRVEGGATLKVHHIKFENMLMYDIGTPAWGENGKVYQFLSDVSDVKIIHNTAESSNAIFNAEPGNYARLTFRNNIVERQLYGFHHAACTEGNGPNYLAGALACGFSPYDFERNVVVNNTELNPSQEVSDSALATYDPPPLVYDIATDWNEVQFQDPTHQNQNYRLKSTSPYAGQATDTKDIGIDQTALDLATSGVIEGTTNGQAVPNNLQATTANNLPLRVQLAWSVSAGSFDHYQIERRQAGTSFAAIGTSTTASFTDNNVNSGLAYLYRVRTVSTGGNLSDPSNIDMATAIIFSDDPLAQGGTTIKLIHLTELRQAVNSVRALAALAPVSWQDTSPTLIRAFHIQDLRNNLDPAITSLNLNVPAYTTPMPTSGSLIRAADFQDLRNRVK